MNNGTYKYYVAIDFGTSNTSCSFWNPVKKIAIPVRFNSTKNRGYKIPSTIFYENYDVIQFGQIADDIKIQSLRYTSDEYMYVQNRIIDNLKSQVVTPEIIVGDNDKVPTIYLLEQFFSFIKEEVESDHIGGEVIITLIFTYPVEFYESYKNSLREAASNLGVENVEFISEPHAVAYNYDGPGKGILILDLGAGTLDMAFLTKNANDDLVFIDEDGAKSLGGRDMDECIYDLILNKAEEATGNSVPKEYYDNLHPLILNYAKETKESMSKAIRKGLESFSITYNLPKNITSKPIKIEITKKEFDQVLKHIIDRIVRKSHNFFSQLDRSGYNIDTFLLAGGASLLPSLADSLNEYFKSYRGEGQSEIEWVLMYENDISASQGACRFANQKLNKTPKAKKDSLEFEFEKAKNNLSEGNNRNSFDMIFNLARDAGYPPAIHEMGNMFLNGIVLKANTLEAIIWYQDALQTGYKPSALALSEIFLASEIPNDWDKGYNMLSEFLKNSENIVDMYPFLKMGECHLVGKGTEVDEAQAISYFKKAIKINPNTVLEELVAIFCRKHFTQSSGSLVAVRDQRHNLLQKEIIESFNRGSLTVLNLKPLIIYNFLKFHASKTLKIIAICEKGIIANNDESDFSPQSFMLWHNIVEVTIEEHSGALKILAADGKENVFKFGISRLPNAKIFYRVIHSISSILKM
jgi:TPR repeat protein